MGNKALYEVRDFTRNEYALSCNLTYDEAHVIFSGHFPGNPIVPGVCTLEMIGDLLKIGIGKNLRLSAAANIKYLQLITPAVCPKVEISWIESEGLYKANAILTDGAVTLFKMSATYTDE